jgi:PAS domain S-box-containing protein
MGDPQAGADTRLFRDIFNASPIGIVVENLEGQPIFANPAFCSFLGFSEDEVRSKHCVDFSPREDAEKDWALFQKLRAGSIQQYQLEKRYFRRDGSLVWANLSISLLKSRPSPLVIAMVEDITEKKAAEEARFRHVAVVESSEDAIISKNLDAVVTSWNAGAERIFGYTEAEAIGRPITILIPAELVDEERQILESVKAGGRIEHHETKRLTKAGNTVDVSVNVGPIRDSTGNIVGFSKIAHDITQRKRAEQALAESEERLRLAAQAARIFAYSWDATTDVIERSGPSAEILGVKKNDAATGAALSAMVHPDDRDRLEAALAKLTVENSNLQITYRIIRPDGAVIWLERNSRAYFDGAGKLTRVIGMIGDVTERKLAEEAVLRVGQKLIAAHEEERVRIARELHDDINQRIALLAVLLDELNPMLSGSSLEAKQRVREALQQVSELGTEVQSLSHRLHSSKLEYLGLVKAVTSFCRELSERQALKIEVHVENVPEELPKEISVTLFRILQEALQNAIKHSGGRHFRVSLRAQSNEIELKVHDGGVGFDPEEAMKGRGLGLISMKERLKLIGGRLLIDSNPTRGTTIYAQAPLNLTMISAAASH